MTQTLTTEAMQEIYEAAVHSEASGSQEAEFELLCKLEDIGGTSATIRKLIDMVRAANREAQPVYQCRLFTTDVDGKQIGEWQDMDKGFYDQYDPYCRRILYTAPPAPAVPEETDLDSARMAVGFNRYIQAGYVDGWNACRAAMLDGPGILWSGFDPAKNFYDAIPDGWKLVPIDATRAMIAAAKKVEEDGYDAMHKAMLAAAPEGGNDA